MTTRHAARPRPAPGLETLHQLYVVQNHGLEVLAKQFGVGKSTVRAWLVDADIPIHRRGAGGYHRVLTPPPAAELRRLCVDEQLSVYALACRLGVSHGTASRWLTEAGLTAVRGSTKNRPRGSDRPMAVPSAEVLWRLYVIEGRSLAAVAQTCGATTHLVSTWMAEAGIARRPAGGRPGQPHRLPRRKPPPPVEELAALQSVQRLNRRQLAERYGVHVSTMSQWLREAGLPTRLPTAAVSDENVVAMYETDGLTASEIARRVGASSNWVLRRLHAAGVRIDPSRQAAAVRAAHASRPRPPALPAGEGDRAERRYRDEGWSYSRIAAELGRPVTAVRRELSARGVSQKRPRYPGRASRTQVSVPQVKRLYVEGEQPAHQVGAALGVEPHVVYRTGHAHGLPIRQGGWPVVSATVELVDGLYADELVAGVLDRHQVPRRPATGDIAVRFPDPVPLTRIRD